MIGDDYQTYISLLSSAQDSAGISVWTYYLMLNHLHLLVIPVHNDNLVVFFRH
ncbi:hypothetical protein [Neptunomonas qingdaonensis]|uniref:hypothetical protein n=1 Tax=Neptunomonas qingdaonensis TaxID=1045558 RepID=UPI0015A530A5|nr:hypothetical protein [Neptunomonas qingdaonensis]